MNLAVCVLFHEKVEQTIECVQSFLPAGVPMVVLNNGSSVASRELFAVWSGNHPCVRLIDVPENLGVSGGRNRLLQQTSEEWLLFVDNDIVVNTPDWLLRLKFHISADAQTEVWIPKLLNLHEERYAEYCQLEISEGKAVLTSTAETRVNNFPGGASCINRTLFERLGNYDESLFVGGEDFELALRGIRSGAPVRARLISDVELIHDHRAVIKPQDVKAVLDRYDTTRISNSYERIKACHGVVLDDGWQAWVSRQLQTLVPGQGVMKTLRSLWGRATLTACREHGQGTIPTTCTLYMSGSCNLTCRGCRRALRDTVGSSDMRLETVRQVLKRYPALNEFCVAGYGEPTLCAEFTSIVDFLFDRGRTVGIITNGVNLTPLLAIQREPAYISISLYGYDNNSYEQYCGSRVFDKVVASYKRMRERFPRIGFSYIVSKRNYLDLAKIIGIFDELQPSFVHLVNYLPYTKDKENEVITVTDLDAIAYIDAVTDGRNFIEIRPCPIDPFRSGHACRSYERTINLDGAGNIGGCQRQVPPDATFGNVFRDSDPFNSTRMRGQRFKIRNRLHPHAECQHCFGNWLSESL